MPGTNEPEIIPFSRDMTLRWPCRGGDFILWMGFPSIFAGPEAIQIRDFWEMRGGYHVTITNRLEDFRRGSPSIRPKCVMSSIQDDGEDKERLQAQRTHQWSNLWRLKAGDRLAWVGVERPERHSVNGVFAILDCQQCALAVGEGNWDSLKEFVGYGAPTTSNMKPEDVAHCQAAVKVVKELGVPCTWATEWRLG